MPPANDEEDRNKGIIKRTKDKVTTKTSELWTREDSKNRNAIENALPDHTEETVRLFDYTKFLFYLILFLMQS